MCHFTCLHGPHLAPADTVQLMCVPSGCLHPDYDGYFTSPADYIKWYSAHGSLRSNTDAPTVAVLLYRKHVITQQAYIPQLIRTLEEQGIKPIPIFINGVEAHTVVRPWSLTAADVLLASAPLAVYFMSCHVMSSLVASQPSLVRLVTAITNNYCMQE